MKCREAQHELALLVGNDLQEASARDLLKQHLTTCSACRQHFRELKQSYAVLDQADKPATYEVRESLWPAVSQRLESRSRTAPAPRRPTWWPMAAVMAACVLLLIFIQPSPQPNPTGIPMERGVLSVPFGRDVDPPPAREKDLEALDKQHPKAERNP